MSKEKRVPIPRDDNHFRYLSPEPTIEEMGIPADAVMELSLKTTAERMAERREWLSKTECCTACQGRGRVLKS